MLDPVNENKQLKEDIDFYDENLIGTLEIGDCENYKEERFIPYFHKNLSEPVRNSSIWNKLNKISWRLVKIQISLFITICFTT